MLYTDTDIATADALARLDSEVRAAAAATKPPIVIEGSGSICEAAWQECGRRITQAIQSYVSYPAQTGMPATHMGAIMNVGVPARTQPRARLNQIVAGEANYAAMDSQIERWVQYYALYLLFRDTSSRLGKDRYEEKMDRYKADAERMWRGLRNEGLPIVYRPMECPGSKHAFSAGQWTSASNLDTVAGGSNADEQNVFVSVTWYDSERYKSQADKGNAESAPAAILPFVIPASQLLKIDITSLNTPNGNPDQVGLSQGTWSPLNATNWNVWVGPSADALYLQHEGVPIGTKTYTLAADPVFSGPVMGRGQFPDLNLVFMNIAMRG